MRTIHTFLCSFRQSPQTSIQTKHKHIHPDIAKVHLSGRYPDQTSSRCPPSIKTKDHNKSEYHHADRSSTDPCERVFKSLPFNQSQLCLTRSRQATKLTNTGTISAGMHGNALNKHHCHEVSDTQQREGSVRVHMRPRARVCVKNHFKVSQTMKRGKIETSTRTHACSLARKHKQTNKQTHACTRARTNAQTPSV